MLWFNSSEKPGRGGGVGFRPSVQVFAQFVLIVLVVVILRHCGHELVMLFCEKIFFRLSCVCVCQEGEQRGTQEGTWFGLAGDVFVQHGGLHTCTCLPVGPDSCIKGRHFFLMFLYHFSEARDKLVRARARVRVRQKLKRFKT